MRYPHFISPSAVSQSPIGSNQELMNFYLEKLPAGGTNQFAHYPTPGLDPFYASADTPGRAIFAEDGRVWIVIGASLYELFRTGTALLRGTLARDQYQATICSNGVTQLFITSGDVGYCLDTTTNVLTTVLASGATMGASLGGYFIAFDLNQARIRISGLLDGLTWDPTQFAQRSLASDPWRSMLVVNGRIYLFGTKTTELWGNTGAFPFPLAPITTNLIQFGIAAPFAAANLQDTAAWLAHSDAGAGQILQTRGLAVEELQDEGVAYALSRFTTIEDAAVWGYEDQGHPFLLFDFPSANATFGYDGNMQAWHKRGYWDSGNSIFTAWRPCGHAHEWDLHLVIDRNSGTVYRMDVSLGLDVGGAPIRRLHRPPALFKENQLLTLDSLEIFLESGLGLVTGQGSDPTVSLHLSRDGKTYGNIRDRSAGKIGQYSKRVRWNRCGQGRILQPEYWCTDPVPWRVIDCFVNVSAQQQAA